VLATDTLLVFCSFFLPSFFLEEGEGGGGRGGDLSPTPQKQKKTKKKAN
jgi:hypothetical protein